MRWWGDGRREGDGMARWRPSEDDLIFEPSIACHRSHDDRSLLQMDRSGDGG